MLPPESTATTGVGEPPRVLQQRRHRRRARRLDDQLRPLQAVQQRPRQRVLVDREDLVDERGDLRRTSRRPAGRPRCRRRSCASTAAPPARPRPATPGTPRRPAACTPDHPRRPGAGLHRRRDAAEQAAAAGAGPAPSRTSGHCSRISSPTVPCPAMTSTWSNGWTSTAPVALGEPRAPRRGSRRPCAPTRCTVGAVPAGGGDLGQRRPLRHEHRGADRRASARRARRPARGCRRWRRPRRGPARPASSRAIRV